MHQLIEILSIVLVSIGMALSLAHALELPGKLRLPRETYIAVQSIYYPGFTIGGFFGEFGAMVATLVLLFATPYGTFSFWLTLAALALLLVMHGLYWALTHPVNKVWLRGQQLGSAGAAFFGMGGKGGTSDAEWTKLRDRWEYSHVARAAMAMLSLVALVAATTI